VRAGLNLEPRVLGRPANEGLADAVVVFSHGVLDERSSHGRFTSLMAAYADAGYPRQAVHGHSLGSLIALRANSPWVQTMILTGALTGPLDYAWGEIFSTAQMEELGRSTTAARRARRQSSRPTRSRRSRRAPAGRGGGQAHPARSRRPRCRGRTS
jgi:hypothetical protein